MFDAVEYGNLEGLKSLVSSGFSIQARHINASTILHIAVSNRNLGIVKFLVECGANVNSINADASIPAYNIGSKQEIRMFSNMQKLIFTLNFLFNFI